MRLVRFTHPDHGVCAGILESDHVRPLEEGIPVPGASFDTPVTFEDVKLLAPVAPSKIIGVGRNYLTHIKEMGYEVPQRPSLFMKPPTALAGPGDAVVLPSPDVSRNVEHEAELGVVIGREARHVDERDVPSFVLGYTCANDVSARDLQRSDTSVIRGKGFDTFCPVGPWIETDVDPAAGLFVRCEVNGELRQDGTTADLVFNVATLVSYLSAFTTLLPGDLILTGSPGGTTRLYDGDTVHIEIEGIGALEHQVVGSER